MQERSSEEVTALCEKARELYLAGKVREAIALSKTMTVEEIWAKAYGPPRNSYWQDAKDDYDMDWELEQDRGHFDWDE